MHCKKPISDSLQRILQHDLNSTVIFSQGTDTVKAVEGTHPITLKTLFHSFEQHASLYCSMEKVWVQSLAGFCLAIIPGFLLRC